VRLVSPYAAVPQWRCCSRLRHWTPSAAGGARVSAPLLSPGSRSRPRERRECWLPCQALAVRARAHIAKLAGQRLPRTTRHSACALAGTPSVGLPPAGGRPAGVHHLLANLCYVSTRSTSPRTMPIPLLPSRTAWSSSTTSTSHPTSRAPATPSVADSEGDTDGRTGVPQNPCSVALFGFRRTRHLVRQSPEPRTNFARSSCEPTRGGGLVPGAAELGRLPAMQDVADAIEVAPSREEDADLGVLLHLL
jgi:hypothetical protein